MIVIGVLIDQLIDIRIWIDGVWPGVVSSGDHVPEMPVHRVGEEHLAVPVPIAAPGMGGPMTKRFENLSLRMIAPDSTRDRNALFIRSSGRADKPRRRCSASSVEPAIWSPTQTIGKVVIVFRRHREAVEHHFGR